MSFTSMLSFRCTIVEKISGNILVHRFIIIKSYDADHRSCYRTVTDNFLPFDDPVRVPGSLSEKGGFEKALKKETL